MTRTWKRVFTQEELWNGNREQFWRQLKLWSDESLFHWLFKTYWRRKREYPQLFARPEYSHLQIIHFKTPQEADLWLEKGNKKSFLHRKLFCYLKTVYKLHIAP